MMRELGWECGCLSEESGRDSVLKDGGRESFSSYKEQILSIVSASLTIAK